MGQAEVLTVGEQALRWAGQEAPFGAVTGFSERYSPWTGRAWLEVRGPGWRVPIGPGYGEARAAIRERLGDRPFDSDWGDGRMPACPGGLPADLATLTALALVLALGFSAAWLTGALGGLAVVVALAWPLARLRDAVVARRAGFRSGPPWAPLTPWYEVTEVCWRRRGRGWAEVWTRGARGSGRSTLPLVLVPALRARVRRLGGLALQEAALDAGDRYASWLAAASGIPWGLMIATVALAAAANAPWVVLSIGLLVVAATTLLGAAVEARATGWGAGAVIWSTAVYATVLAAIGLSGLLTGV